MSTQTSARAAWGVVRKAISLDAHTILFLEWHDAILFKSFVIDWRTL